jgi:hypothetical protein
MTVYTQQDSVCIIEYRRDDVISPLNPRMHQWSPITTDRSVCLFPHPHLRTTWSSYALVKISYISLPLFCWNPVGRDPFGNSGWAHLAAGVRSCCKRVITKPAVTFWHVWRVIPTRHVSLMLALRARTAERHVKLCFVQLSVVMYAREFFLSPYCGVQTRC